jgi:cation diffusion facilitator family transporter
MLIAVFAALLGFNLVKDGILGLMSPPEVSPTRVAEWVMIISIGIKVMMVIAYRKAWQRTESLAIQASLVDSRNDILATSVALFGFLVGGLWDALAAAFIGAWIIWSGVRIGIDNLDYLMGRSPSAETIERLRSTALSVPGVQGTNDVLAHYVGDELHVEVHAEVDPTINIELGHTIESELRTRLEELPEVGRAFIHLDPVAAKSH